MNKTKISTIKKTANEAYINQDYQLAFQILWDVITVDEFFIYISKDKNNKTNWLANNQAFKILWDSFLCNDTRLNKLLLSSFVEKNLYYYFGEDNTMSKRFEFQLANKFPEVYLKCVRVNQLFYKKERLNFLLEDVLFQPEYKIHKEVWRYFYDKELYYWSQIQAQFKTINEYTLEEILYNLIAVLESQRLKTTSLLEEQNISEAYNFFIELLLSTKDIQLTTKNRDLFEFGFFKYIFNPKQVLNASIDNVIILILDRKSLIDVYIDPYSFEDGTEIKIENGTMSIVMNGEGNERWFKGGKRYSINEQLYFNHGEGVVEKLISEGLIIAGKNESDVKDNRDMANRSNAIRLVLSDLGITNFYEGKTPIAKVGNVIPPIHTLAFNRLVRYERVLKETNKNNNQWLSKYLSHIRQNLDKSQLPFFYINIEEYRELNNNAANSFTKEHTTEILELFSCDLRNNTFNRFEKKYNVFSQPYVRLESYIFCPTFCLTLFTGIYVYVDMLIKNNGNKTAINIEEVLEKYLTSRKWDTKRVTDNEANQINGDADLILSDEKTVLLLQLKRTNLRLETKEIYLEKINIDHKASQQLNAAEVSFSRKNSVLNIKNRKVKKWIVSTSLEGISEVIDDCLKVSYFELLHLIKILQNECQHFDTLDDFINCVETDYFFKSINSNQKCK